MTDNSGLVPNNVGITSDLLYNMKPSSARGRSYRCSIQPTNKQSFNPGDTCIMYLPCGRRNTYLDPQQSYIKYTVTNADTVNSINFDGCGASVINRLDVFHASNMLESIQQYNVLYNYLLDFQINASQRLGLSTVYGFNNNISASGTRAGLTLAANGTNGNITVCMPLLSGVVGMGLDKMLPVGNLNDDIRLEFTFETQNVGMVYSTATSPVAWTVSGIELELTYIELSDEAQSIVSSVTNLNDTVFLHGNSWRHYVSSLAASTSGTYSTLVPCRFASTKSLLCLPRRSTEITSANSYSLGSRVNPGIDQYWWRVGSALIPQKYVTLKNSNLVFGYGEGFMEIQKSFHSINHPEFASAVGIDQFNVADIADTNVGGAGITAVGSNLTTTSYKNAFAIAQELETYAQKSDVLLSGYNTLSAQTFFECNIGTGPTNGYTLDFYANFDQILVKDAMGILSVRF